jgi:deazaflavin-dependent oxidoreductase (nitroreductase family)
MWFMNKIANPFVRLILRSPFHKLMSATVLLITYRGRKSGRTYTLPVNYVQDGRTITIIPGMAEHKNWWRSLCGGAPVQIRLAGRRLAGNATVLTGEADASQIVPALALYLQHFPAAAKMRNLQPSPNDSFNPDELLQAAASTVLVRVDLLS